MQKKLQILPNKNESIIIKTERQDGMVQHRAVRYTCNRYHNTSSVSHMLVHQYSAVDNTKMRRIQTRLVVFYNIIGYTDTLQYTTKIL
jgi:hypothetical protein